MPHPIGFSTGALAKGDFRRAIQIQQPYGLIAIELSALRDTELKPLIEAIPTLDQTLESLFNSEEAHRIDLSPFQYVSVHAPSKLSTLSEQEVFETLASLPRDIAIVVHPELLSTPSLWRTLGFQLCIENMDNRKTLGRTVSELQELFREFPRASFCLDVGHARQIDPTMSLAIEMLSTFKDRLCQVHVSEVGPRGEHKPTAPASSDYVRVAPYIPHSCPLIIESVVDVNQVEQELQVVAETFA